MRFTDSVSLATRVAFLAETRYTNGAFTTSLTKALPKKPQTCTSCAFTSQPEAKTREVWFYFSAHGLGNKHLVKVFLHQDTYMMTYPNKERYWLVAGVSIHDQSSRGTKNDNPKLLRTWTWQEIYEELFAPLWEKTEVINTEPYYGRYTADYPHAQAQAVPA